VIVGYAGAKQLRKREEGSGGLGFLDSDGKKTGNIVIDAHPESFQLEKAGTRLFVNVPDKREVEVIDVVKRTVLARWPVTSAQNNFPMALDEADHRLFVVCRNPANMVVLDTLSGKVVETLVAVGDCDDVFYDSVRKRIYAIGGEGAVSVFQQQAVDRYRELAKITTSKGARTGLFSPDLRRLFVAARRDGSRPAEIRIYEVQ
jgi:DNA-binding beta-propeller fold protein YncE